MEEKIKRIRSNQRLGLKTDLHNPVHNNSGISHMEVQANAQEIKVQVRKELERDLRAMLAGYQESNERIEQMI